MKIKKAKGFSLVEMMLVVALLAIALTIAVPNFNKYLHNTNLKTAARDLTGEIFNFKHTAVAQGVHYKIVFDKTANNYKIMKGGPNSSDAFDEGNAAVRNLDSYASYIAIDSLTGYTSASSPLLIQPRGTTSAGSITLKNDIGSKIIITISLMGKVSVDKNLQ